MNAVGVFTCTISSLTEGVAAYVTLSAYDIGGWSSTFQILARPYSQSPAPQHVVVKAVSTGNIALTWSAPPTLTISDTIRGGLYLSGYVVEVRMPLGAADGVWTVLARTTDAAYVHQKIQSSRVTLYYAVSALVSQNASFGAATSAGDRALAQVYFGRIPAWIEAPNASTPQNGAVLIVPRGGVLNVQLDAFAPDVQSSTLTLRMLQALPPTARFGVPITTSLPAVTIKQNLSVSYSPDLAGSRYSVCVTAQDAGGLEAQPRCFVVAMPRAQPRLVRIQHMTAFT